jgi:hypothetical protein
MMAKKTAARKTTGKTKNFDKLTKAGVIPKGYTRLSTAEKAAIEGLSASEVQAIVGTKTKLGRKFFPQHASHGMLY